MVVVTIFGWESRKSLGVIFIFIPKPVRHFWGSEKTEENQKLFCGAFVKYGNRPFVDTVKT